MPKTALIDQTDQHNGTDEMKRRIYPRINRTEETDEMDCKFEIRALPTSAKQTFNSNRNDFSREENQISSL
jgi:hypothetical protein